METYCKEICCKENKCSFCFYDKQCIINCICIPLCDSPYTNCIFTGSDIQNIRYKNKTLYYLFYIFWCLPTMIFIVTTFWMIIIFVCCCTPPLFILLLNMPFLNPNPETFSIFDVCQKKVESPDPSRAEVLFYFLTAR
jgi:hypothetical protein